MIARELIVLVPLVVLTIFFGIYPAPINDVTAAAVSNMVVGVEQALQAAELAGDQALGGQALTNLPAPR